ncbi:hypothetical protein COLO4_00785, partial [Corchorus olitorius]
PHLTLIHHAGTATRQCAVARVRVCVVRPGVHAGFRHPGRDQPVARRGLHARCLCGAAGRSSLRAAALGGTGRRLCRQRRGRPHHRRAAAAPAAPPQRAAPDPDDCHHRRGHRDQQRHAGRVRGRKPALPGRARLGCLAGSGRHPPHPAGAEHHRAVVRTDGRAHAAAQAHATRPRAARDCGVAESRGAAGHQCRRPVPADLVCSGCAGRVVGRADRPVLQRGLPVDGPADAAQGHRGHHPGRPGRYSRRDAGRPVPGVCRGAVGGLHRLDHARRGGVRSAVPDPAGAAARAVRQGAGTQGLRRPTWNGSTISGRSTATWCSRWASMHCWRCPFT